MLTNFIRIRKGPIPLVDSHPANIGPGAGAPVVNQCGSPARKPSIGSGGMPRYRYGPVAGNPV